MNSYKLKYFTLAMAQRPLPAYAGDYNIFWIYKNDHHEAQLK